MSHWNHHLWHVALFGQLCRKSSPKLRYVPLRRCASITVVIVIVVATFFCFERLQLELLIHCKRI